MAQSSRTFRVFVSSTFSDLEAERNALQKEVFPRLRELVAAHDCRFQAIDLRWGVSEEASLDQQAMQICLGEIERCQKVSPRPNFIVLLGDRYGWCPPPSRIPEAEFQQILGVITQKDDKALLIEWYFLDKNAIPGEWRLKARLRGSEYEAYSNWQPVEAHLHAILAEAVVKLNFPDEQRLPYSASATEQEIAAGALSVKDAPEHVFCFFRNIDNLPQQVNTSEILLLKDSLNLDEKGGQIDQDAFKKQQNLKERLQKHVPQNVFPYQARWTGDGITQDHIAKLCRDVYFALERIMLAEIEQPHESAPFEEEKPHIQPDAWLDAEGLAQHAFAEERLRFFVGRTQLLAKIEGYLASSERHPLAIVGEGGTGKSALMARAIQQTQEKYSNAQIVYRFIGATPTSSDGRSLLHSLCHELARRYGADIKIIPTDYRELVPELGKLMGLASASRPLLLFLDSLDQLSLSQDARSLVWLPAELPEHVSVIASTRVEDTLKALQAKQARVELLGGLSSQEGDDLLSQWLASVHRTLQKPQRKEVLDKFEKSKGNPLYHRLAFEEARLWTSGQSQEKLAPGVRGIIEKNMIERLEKEGSHGEVLVAHALGYLAASRYGLAEDELLELLSRDLQVYSWFFRKSFHVTADLVASAIQYRRSHPNGLDREVEPSHAEPERGALAWLNEIRNSPQQLMDFLTEVLPKADGPRLPVVLWSRLSFDLAPYLAERMLDGSPLLNFYHRELGDVARTIFLANGKDQLFHANLADFFRHRSDPTLERAWTGGYTRGLSELPYHLAGAGNRDELYKTLTDFRFLEHKAAEVGVTKDLKWKYTGPLLLRDDFALALPLFGVDSIAGGKAPLIVTGVNFGEGPVIRCPWCHVYLPFNEKWRGAEIACPHCQGPLRINAFLVGESIFETKLGLTETISDSVSDDRGVVLAAFQRALSRETHILTEHVELLWQQLYNWLQWEGEAVASTLAHPLAERNSHGPDAVPWLHTLTPFGESTALLATFVDSWNTGFIHCAFSPDGRFIVVGRGRSSQYNKLEIWDAESGQELGSASSHADSITSCAFSPDGRYIASAGSGSSYSGSLILWDPDKLTKIHALEAIQMSWCAFTPDGRFLISTGGVPGIRRWNLETGSLEPVIIANDRTLARFAISPDGGFIVPFGFTYPLVLLDLSTGSELRKLQTEAMCIAFTPDGRFIVSGKVNGTLILQDVRTGSTLMTFTGHTDSVLTCAVSPDGRFIVSGGKDRTLRLWDLIGGANLGTLSGHTDYISSCAFSPDGRFITSGSNDATLKIWDVKSIGESQTEPMHTDLVSACAFSPDGNFIVSASRDGTLRLWNATTGKERSKVAGQGFPLACSFSPDSRFIASGGTEGSLKLWETESIREVWALARLHNGTNFCEFTPDGRYIISAGGIPGDTRSRMKVCDAASGKEVATLIPQGENILACALSPDGRQIVEGGSATKNLRFWDIETAKEVRTLVGAYVTACAFSPDGRFVISAGSEGARPVIKLWSLQTGSEMWTYEDAPYIRSIVFTPDGQFVLSTCADGTVRLFDAESGRELSTLALLGYVGSIATHSALRLAVCGDASGNVYRIELVGIEYGPLIVTAKELDDKFSVCCPACQNHFQVGEDKLGSTITCPTPACNTRLKVNSFVISKKVPSIVESPNVQSPEQKKNKWFSKLLNK